MLRYLGITGAGRTTTWIGQNGDNPVDKVRPWWT